MSSASLGLATLLGLLALTSGVAGPSAVPLAKTPVASVSATDWDLYGAQLRSAYQAWQLGNVEDALRDLEACRWDLRGWEHRHLCAMLMRNQAILLRNGSRAVFTPEGRLLMREPNGVLGLYDGRTLEEIDTTRFKSISRIHVAVSGVEGLIATGAKTTLRIHQGKLNKIRRSWVAHAKGITAVVMSRDGTRVASGANDKTLCVWDSLTGKKLLDLTGHKERVDDIVFSPDGSRLVSVSPRRIRVWDARTGRVVATREAYNITRLGVAFSPDGRRILSAIYDTALLCDTTTGRERMRFQVKDSGLSRVAFCPDGLAIATGHEDGTVRLWETRTGRLLETFRGHTKEVEGISFSPEGGRLVTSSSDGTVRMWDARSSVATAEDYSRDRDSDVENRILGVHGSRVVTLSLPWGLSDLDGYAMYLSAWDIETGRRLYQREWDSEHGLPCAAVSPDGNLLATGETWGMVRIRDAATGLPKHIYLQHLIDDVVAVAWSPDGRRVVSASQKGFVRVWEASSGKHVRFFWGPHDLRRLAFSPDGTLLACEGGSPHEVGQIWVLDTRTGAIRYTFPNRGGEPATAMAFSPDGTRLLYSVNGELKACDGQSGRVLPSIDPFRGRSWRFTFSPDGTRLLTWGDKTLTVRVFKSGRTLLTLPLEGMNSFAFGADGRLISAGGLTLAPRREESAGHDARVLPGSDGVERYSLRTNRDGAIIAGISAGNDVIGWQAATGKRLFRYRPFREAVRDIAFTSSGKTLVARSDEGKVKIRAWVVQKGGKLPDPSFAWPDEKAPKPPTGYEFEEREGKIALVHRDQATEDRAPMTRWAQPDIAWHLRRLDDAVLDGDDYAVDHHLRFLLRDPIQHLDAALHIHHAHVLARLGKRRESAAQLAWALFLNPHISLWPITSDGVSERIEHAAEAGDWARVLRGYRAYNDDEPSLVLVEIAAGVPPASRHRLRESACRQLDWDQLRWAMCVPATPAATRALHMTALASHRAVPPPDGLGRLGAAQYRLGRYNDAVRTLARAAKAPETEEETFVTLFQALTAKQLGRDAEAKAALARAEAALAAQPIKRWRDRIALGVLLAETRAALLAPARMTHVPEGE